MLAANPNKPSPTLFLRLPCQLHTTFSLGGDRVFMCFLLNPAPCSVNPVLCLVRILVIDRLFGIFDSFILYDVHLIRNYFPRYSTILIFLNNSKFSLGWCS